MIDKFNRISQQPLDELLKERLGNESQKAAPPLQEDTQCYLVNLLERFSLSERFFDHTDTGFELQTLALLYKEAYDCENTAQRYRTLRRLGDSALFMGGLFQEKFKKIGLGKDYFVGMGGGAYGYLSQVSYGNPEVFKELSRRFPMLIRIVGKVCSRNIEFDAQEIFALYQRWQDTRDESIRSQLRSLGITPFDHKTYQ